MQKRLLETTSQNNTKKLLQQNMPAGPGQGKPKRKKRRVRNLQKTFPQTAEPRIKQKLLQQKMQVPKKQNAARLGLSRLHAMQNKVFSRIPHKTTNNREVVLLHAMPQALVV